MMIAATISRHPHPPGRSGGKSMGDAARSDYGGEHKGGDDGDDGDRIGNDVPLVADNGMGLSSGNHVADKQPKDIVSIVHVAENDTTSDTGGQ